MLLSLDALAKKHGQIAPDVVDGSRYKWQHRVADMVHGWTLHNYHHQAHPVLLSDEAYLAALAAAENGLDAHEAAKPTAVFPLPQPSANAETNALRARIAELEADAAVRAGQSQSEPETEPEPEAPEAAEPAAYTGEDGLPLSGKPDLVLPQPIRDSALVAEDIDSVDIFDDANDDESEKV